jgi:nitrogen regulatory protein PII
MNTDTRKLITIITEAALEHSLIEDLNRLGAHGYTITNARGKGSRGVRDAGWGASSNIRVEVMCDARVSEVITTHLREHYYDNYAMILFLSDVEVLRPEKF